MTISHGLTCVYLYKSAACEYESEAVSDTQRVHLTDIGESLHKRNELDQEQLQWMMKGKGVAGADQTSCVDRFQFIKN